MLHKVATTSYRKRASMGRIHWCGGLPPERTVSQGGLRAIAAALSALGCVARMQPARCSYSFRPLAGKENHSSPFPSLGVARAGAVAPTTTSARGATRVGHPIASSIRPRSDTPAGRGVSQVPVSQFLTSEPLEDGTDCAAVAVIFSWEFGHDPCPPWGCCQRAGCPAPGKGASTTAAGMAGQSAKSRDTWAGAQRSRPAGVRTPSLF